MDCMEYMKSLPDNAFDLAIVDPPYGIKINMNQGRRKGQELKHEKKEWDNFAPTIEYWESLKRVSKNQIVWGANNFNWIPAHNGWIVWDKDITGNVEFSKAELAYNSCKNTVSIVKIRAQSGNEVYSNKIHPTQKPVKLYEWLLTNYAKQGDKILDTHLGSGSHAIACNNLDFELVGCELDSDYFKESCERVAKEAQQERLF
jgi:site-specific DNA-methyltransferase (adenine-specific)